MKKQEQIGHSDASSILRSPERLAALGRLELLDTTHDAALDDLARFIARVLSVPALAVLIVGETAVALKGAVGISEPSDSPRLVAALEAIAGTILVTQAPQIADAQHPWPPDHPARLVPDLAACAAIPLTTSDGHVCGVLCAFDAAQRVWTADSIANLQEFARRCIRDIEQCCETNDLRAREEVYRTLFAHAPIGQSLGTADGWVVTANPALCEMLGYTEEELLQLHFPTLTHPDDRQLTYEYMRRMASGERPSFDFEKRFIRKDGSIVHVRSSVALVRDAQGKPKYGIGVIQDIGERKRLEAQLAQAQRMETVGQLAGGIAHDFNNLLTAIIGYAELARDSVAQHSQVYEDMVAIKDTAERGALLTRQLLAFGRRQIMIATVFNLNTMICDVERLLRRLIGEDIDFVTHTEPGLHSIKGDPSQLEQVLINLAVNARDAMPQGGKLTIETSNVLPDEMYAQEHVGPSSGSHVMLAISDNGVGMPPEVQAHVFEPFFTTKEPGHGTGLGLATCYAIVKQHSGSIWIYSEPNQGTTVKIYLPVATDTAVDAWASDSLAALPRGSETVLLVEDDIDVRTLVSRVLRSQGYHVLETASGREALRMLQHNPSFVPQLLVTDVVMPEMSGKLLADQVVALYPQIKVLFMSGYTGNALAHHGQLEPGVTLLQKPFSQSTLANMVRVLLDT